jgi:ADP-ribose pyrophosphatase YjhB (NUDIX family)
MDEEIKKQWVGGVCTKDEKVLLIHRINKERILDQEYFVFPGKIVEDNESLEDALIDSFKELSISVKIGELLYSKDDEGDEAESYYACSYIAGELRATTTKNNEEGKTVQFFTPMWVSLNELEELIVYPESVKEILLEELTEK